ncbi:murein L,D-transpeptidase catalytic domain family protein [Chitinophagaceae bacterium MMS25-I14]
MNELKTKALELATSKGQSNALKAMFERFPASNANYWAVVDFNLPSSTERLFIFDLKSQAVKSFLVAHGKKSGLAFATKFSNEIGSNCSSLGIYKTLQTYTGKHGESLRIAGLDKTNSNVLTRAVVIHKADYVVPNYEGTGRAGRSDGCFAVNPSDKDEVIQHLRDGSYINAWHI